MILDVLAQCHRYAMLMPRLVPAFEFLKTVDISRPDGRYEIVGSDVYASIQRYTTKPVAQGALEAHRKYTDVQFIVSGRETILWASLSAAKEVIQPYSAEKDITFFGHVLPVTIPLRLNAGQFAIFFPEDAHAPCLQSDGPSDVVKVVVKVRN